MNLKGVLFIFLSLTFFGQSQKLDSVKQFYSNKEYAKTIKLIDEVFKESNNLTKKEEAVYLFYKADCLFYIKKYKKSIKVTKKVLRLLDKDSNNNRLKGNSYWIWARSLSGLGKSNKSMKKLLKASGFMNDSYLFSTIGYRYIKKNNNEKAQIYIERALIADPYNAYAYNNRGLLKIIEGDFIGARIDINLSIRLDNKNPYAYKHRALLNIKMKQSELVCQDLQKAKKLGYREMSIYDDPNEVDLLLLRYCSN